MNQKNDTILANQ